VSWKEEFGEEFAVPPEISNQMLDDSWHNDVCPRFTSPDISNIVVWVDHPDPDQREMCGSRFTVIVEKEYGEAITSVQLSTDTASEVLDEVVRLEALGKKGIFEILGLPFEESPAERFEDCRLEQETVGDRTETFLNGTKDGIKFSASLDLFLIKEGWGKVDLEDLADGFGPGVGTKGDWSAIRDSSPEARGKMLTRVLNHLFPK